jgi:hypothetical protein
MRASFPLVTDGVLNERTFNGLKDVNASDNDILNSLERSRAVREEFVKPLYLRLLHANFTRPATTGSPEQGAEGEMTAVRTQIVSAARVISYEQIHALLSDREWRGRLVAGWLVGLSMRTDFIDPIADLLLASKQPYSGQGFCVALGLIGNDKSRQYLREYLAKYLPLDGRFYDQDWAIGALTHIEKKSPQEFLAQELWTEGERTMDSSQGIARFASLVEFIDAHRMRIVR